MMETILAGHQHHANLATGLHLNGNSVKDMNSDAPPEIDIVISNVVSTFSCKCHLNLRRVAQDGANVEYRRENGVVMMKLRNPYTTASIWSSGKVSVTGATSEDNAKIAARRIARILQKMGNNVRFCAFRVVNVLGTCAMPFTIRIARFSQANPENSSYEPEIHPGVTYRIKSLRAVLKVFSTGKITVTAPSVENVGYAIQHVYPLVVEHKMNDLEPTTMTPSLQKPLASRASNMAAKGRAIGNGINGHEDYDSDQEDGVLLYGDEDFDSDNSDT